MPLPLPSPYLEDAASLEELATATQQNFDEISRRWVSNTEKYPYAYQNGWRNYNGNSMSDAGWGGQGYYKDSTGIVHLEGLIDKAGGNWIPNEVILALPSGFRALNHRLFHPLADPPYVGTRVDVHSNGNVVLVVGGASNPVGWLSLDGINFRAA